MAVESAEAKERRRLRNAKARERGKLRVNELAEALGKTPTRCERCGKESKRKGALHWHHMDPESKEFHLAHVRSQSDGVIVAELEKCERICKSCHRYHHSVASQGTIRPRPECSFEVRFTVPTRDDAERLRDMVIQAKLSGEIHVEIRPEVEEAKRLLEAEGWAVVQSDGCADLWAAKARNGRFAAISQESSSTDWEITLPPGQHTEVELRLIQVKGNAGSPWKTFCPKDRDELSALAAQTGGVAELWHWPPRGKCRVYLEHEFPKPKGNE